ncbi:hypothetical protein QQP08_015130 [Theobroma cacao]|uniref:Uncharacterized protein n=1 Tax=Theobroma cacao TaxID=3641 RepID=A0A061ENP8_THECC|nr:Uncharacterized protein TCM_021055 [Theobroma cacao]WRX22643.1 hypothetical protein QQP08_015130 [Theobroma cacao]
MPQYLYPCGSNVEIQTRQKHVFHVHALTIAGPSWNHSCANHLLHFKEDAFPALNGSYMNVDQSNEESKVKLREILPGSHAA